MRQYSVYLWDHDPAEDGSEEGRFSGELARQHLEGPNEGLGFHEIGRAMRTLRSHGWSEVSVLIERTDDEED